MTTKPTITNEDREAVFNYRNNAGMKILSAEDAALHFAAALREERERNAAMIRAREEVEEYMREKAKEKAKKPHDWAWGITEIALYAADLKARNAELERAVGELREALSRAKKMIGPHSLHPDAEGFCIVEHVLASTAHLVNEKEKK